MPRTRDTLRIQRRCANCPTIIRVPKRGGRRYCLKCLVLRRAERHAEAARKRVIALSEHAKAAAEARRMGEKQEYHPLSIMERERIILGWMRTG